MVVSPSTECVHVCVWLACLTTHLLSVDDSRSVSQNHASLLWPAVLLSFCRNDESAVAKGYQPSCVWAGAVQKKRECPQQQTGRMEGTRESEEGTVHAEDNRLRRSIKQDRRCHSLHRHPTIAHHTSKFLTGNETSPMLSEFMNKTQHSCALCTQSVSKWSCPSTTLCCSLQRQYTLTFTIQKDSCWHTPAEE